MSIARMLRTFTLGRGAARANVLHFAGVGWGDPLATVQRKLHEAGHVVDGTDAGDIAFHGRVFGYAGTGWVYFARGAALKVTFSVRPQLADVLRTYDHLRSALRRQYGPTPHVAELFEPPFARNDGRELEGIPLGKVFLATAWREQPEVADVGLILLVTRELAVKLSYEGPGWTAEAQRRLRVAS